MQQEEEEAEEEEEEVKLNLWGLKKGLRVSCEMRWRTKTPMTPMTPTVQEA